MADPGFPLGGGGTEPLEGANLQHGCFLAKMYAKTKELDPVGGMHAGSTPWICQLGGGLENSGEIFQDQCYGF